MSRLPLSTFVPIGSSDSVIRLVDYLSVLKSRERYKPQDCIAAITSEALKIQFCREVIKREIYSISDNSINSVMRQAQRKKEMRGLVKLETDRNKLKEERRQRKPEAQILKTERKQKDKPTKKGSVKEMDKQIRQSLSLSTNASSLSSASETNIIARDVKASSFSVINGCIYYLSYKLESVRIPAIPSEILNNIERTFTIKKDYSSFRSSKTDLRFIFEPADDLSKFLIEATKVSLKLGSTAVYADKAIEEHGIFNLPWKNVIFRDGYMYLTHPKAKGKETISPFKFDSPLIHRNYADLMPYIEKHATKLLVEGHDGKITRLINFDEFAKIFPHLTSYTLVDDQSISIEKGRPIVNHAYSLEELRDTRLINKSQFLAFLCKVQKIGYKIYYLLENVIHESSDSGHDEFGFLFVIRESITTLTLLYENVTDESRSSLVFNVDRSEFNVTVKFIAQFLASNEENKRLKLARRQIRFSRYIKSYERILHTTYEEWRRHTNHLINCRGY